MEVEYADYHKKMCNIKVEGGEYLGFENGFLKIKTSSKTKVKITFTEKDTEKILHSSDWLVY